MKHPSLLLYFLICVIPYDSAHAGGDPAALQQQAISRIEDFIDHFRRTGDHTSRLSELQQAQKELMASHTGFVQRGEQAPAALSLIQLGDVQRLQNKWQEAQQYYERGYDLAKRADHIEYQARARLG